MTNAPRGWASFAWQSDYGQFYLVDCENDGFRPPQAFTDEMEEDSLFVPPAGLVVYTAGCLQQQVRIAIHAAEPAMEDTEWMSGKPWTRTRTADVSFPSRRFVLTSPSKPDPLPAGPFFLLDGEDVRVRIRWMEFDGERDDSVPVEPDVIDIALWPRDAGADRRLP